MGSATVLLAGLQPENNTKNFYLVSKITTTLTVTPGLPLSKERPPRLLSIQIPLLPQRGAQKHTPAPKALLSISSLPTPTRHDILTPGAQQPGPCPALPYICSALVLHWPWTRRPAQFCGLCTGVSLKEGWGQRVWVRQHSRRRSRADFELTGLGGAYRAARVRVYVLFHVVILGDRFCYLGEH
uniref:Uncharacterized protein n=1 Tax=Mandrillus leucophaeus TaxID=9568 RepID=A0A2K5XHU0_MANLE